MERMDLYDFFQFQVDRGTEDIELHSDELNEKAAEIIGIPTECFKRVSLMVDEELALCVELDEEAAEVWNNGETFVFITLTMDCDFWAFQEEKGNSTYGTLMHTAKRQARNFAVIAKVRIGNRIHRIKYGIRERHRAVLTELLARTY